MEVLDGWGVVVVVPIEQEALHQGRLPHLKHQDANHIKALQHQRSNFDFFNSEFFL